MAFLDFGATTNIALNSTMNSVERNLITSANASSLINCRISIGNITFENSNGCYVTIQNLCSASASASLEAVISAVTDTLNTLSIAQQDTIKPSLVKFGLTTNVSENTLAQDFRTNVTNICTASSVVNNTIDIQNISFTSCSTTGAPIEFKFINTGQASANCAINLLLNTNMDLVNNLTAENKSFIDFNLSFTTISILVGILCGSILLVYIFYKMFNVWGRLTGKDLVNLGKYAVVGNLESRFYDIATKLLP